MSCLNGLCIAHSSFSGQIHVVITFPLLPIEANVEQHLLTAWRNKDQGHKLTSNLLCHNSCRIEECCLHLVLPTGQKITKFKNALTYAVAFPYSFL